VSKWVIRIGGLKVTLNPYGWVKTAIMSDKPVTVGNLLGWMADELGYKSAGSLLDAVLAGEVTNTMIRQKVRESEQALAIQALAKIMAVLGTVDKA